MDNKQLKNNALVQSNKEKKPNENVGFYFSSALKIFDPNSNRILVQKRSDG